MTCQDCKAKDKEIASLKQELVARGSEPTDWTYLEIKRLESTQHRTDVQDKKLDRLKKELTSKQLK